MPSAINAHIGMSTEFVTALYERDNNEGESINSFVKRLLTDFKDGNLVYKKDLPASVTSTLSLKDKKLAAELKLINLKIWKEIQSAQHILSANGQTLSITPTDLAAIMNGDFDEQGRVTTNRIAPKPIEPLKPQTQSQVPASIPKTISIIDEANHRFSCTRCPSKFVFDPTKWETVYKAEDDFTFHMQCMHNRTFNDEERGALVDFLNRVDTS